MYFGSKLYGYNDENSDTDFKTVRLIPINDCLLNKIPKPSNKSTSGDKTRNTNKDIDDEIFSLQHFIEYACNGETAMLDMLHCNEENLIETSWVWNEIVKNKKRFYTRKLKAFVGYARKMSEVYCLRSERLHTFQQVLDFLKCQDLETKLTDIWDSLPMLDYIHILDDSKNKDIKFYQVNGRKFQSTARVGYIIPIIEGFIDDYGDRVKRAREKQRHRI